ncbi:MAG: type II toxin-antitoxin system HipA family toxin [Desulfobacteraceae bacterium]|nr:type II toxin-antitoxin system HipA family toxin [Desulfobacteraceae bacterium]
MINLKIKITFPDNTSLFCGEIVTTKPDHRGAIQGAFRYTAEYLNHAQAFPLDPVNLPLSPDEFEADRSTGVHSVFEDALPDAWGRQLLIKKANLQRNEQIVPKLLEVMGNSGLGSLSFYSKQTEHQDTNSSAPITDLKKLLDAAIRYDSGLKLKEADIELLFRHGSTPGGDRPKGLIQKQDHSFWIAKFPKANDKYDVEPIEAATLELAKQSGLTVPDFEIQKIGKRKALLLRRFDISNNGGRYHMISMQTLLQADGYYHINYNELFEIIKHYSCQPSIDIPFLFHQMVFNVAIGNTDDHLKNFCMLHKEPGYCLSPAYDLLPDIHGKMEHTLSFPYGTGYLPPGRMTLEKIGKSYNIENHNKIIDKVFRAVSDWQCVFQKYGVPESDIQRLKWNISRRIDSLK